MTSFRVIASLSCHVTANFAATSARKQAKCRDRPISRANESDLRLGDRLLPRRAGFLPPAKAIREMRDRLQSHLLRRLRGQQRPPPAGAEEHKLLVLGENRLVVRAFRVDPE